MRTVFVSYRRGDSEGQARALKNDLVELIGKSSVFMDVDNIALGQDFRHVLQERLESCDVLLALIGPGWLDAKDGEGNRRPRKCYGPSPPRNCRCSQAEYPGDPCALARRASAVAGATARRYQGTGLPPCIRARHSTWESDVREMVRRLELDKEAAVSTAGTRWVKTAWLMVAVAAIVIIATAVSFRKAPNRGSDTRPIENGAAARPGGKAAPEEAPPPRPESIPAPARGPERTAAPLASVSSEPPRGATVVSPLEKSSGGSPSGVVSRAFPGESGAANSVSVSPGSRLLAAGYQSGVVSSGIRTTVRPLLLAGAGR